MIRLLVCLLLPALVLFGCSHNTAPATYVKDVVATKEGDGLLVYIVLADKDGQMTANDGLLSCFFESKIKGLNKYQQIGSRIKSVELSDFKTLTVGRGPFEHEVLGYMVERIPYSEFGSAPPWQKNPDLYTNMGRVRVEFTSNGQRKKGSTDVTF